MKNRTKWILLSIVILLIVFFGLYRFYLYIQEDIWQGENAAVTLARQETGLVESEKVWKSVWDDVCWVVLGKNADGVEIMVWMAEGKAAVEKPLSEGVSEQQIRKIIQDQLPGINIVRLTPGIYNNQYVWQLFYKDKSHHYYRFFSFSNGEPLSEVFTLPNR
ncbi:DUF5590 domain-containing protein [Paenibacillus sp. D2_2]|uniref:cell wall elongation regulator TseB-like domain-containing protein n=1 Tax=Paenibacillus sp. D2_2 TaxID=3073092 RepID=UPI0028156E87|nr:DUF5590 domain-containing protein [Paenibacillus sp. D2_2]WMT42727.1 DUF5590 domain-containing protein [Paenibacillus sp. D2_2]